MKNSGFTLKKRLKSFCYAFNGVFLLLRYEHNAWIHASVALCVIVAGSLIGLSSTEWLFIVVAIGTVLAAEAIKRTKDLAAGAVLILSIAAAITGLIIFLPKLTLL